MEELRIQEEEESMNESLPVEELQLKMELETNTSRVIVAESSVVPPKLLTYQGVEDITTFLTQFERTAKLLQVDQVTYVVRLGSQLTGKAAEIYTTLPPETTEDYQLLKQTLLRGFEKTADGYRFDFCSPKIRQGENCQQFSTHCYGSSSYGLMPRK